MIVQLLILWFGPLVLCPRGRGWFMLCVILPCCLDWWLGSCPVAAVNAEDVAHWPYTPGLLVKWVAFSGSLHWLVGGADLGVGGVSHVELLIFSELWAGERSTLEKAHPRYLRPGRPVQCRLFRLVQALIYGALVGSLVL